MKSSPRQELYFYTMIIKVRHSYNLQPSLNCVGKVKWERSVRGEIKCTRMCVCVCVACARTRASSQSGRVRAAAASKTAALYLFSIVVGKGKKKKTYQRLGNEICAVLFFRHRGAFDKSSTIQNLHKSLLKTSISSPAHISSAALTCRLMRKRAQTILSD